MCLCQPDFDKSSASEECLATWLMAFLKLLFFLSFSACFCPFRSAVLAFFLPPGCLVCLHHQNQLLSLFCWYLHSVVPILTDRMSANVTLHHFVFISYVRLVVLGVFVVASLPLYFFKPVLVATCLYAGLSFLSLFPTLFLVSLFLPLFCLLLSLLICT